MSLEKELLDRSGSTCELCGATENLSIYEVPPSDGSADKAICVCATCKEQIENPEAMDENHWHCLSDSMWSQVPAVQVMAYRMLKRLQLQDQLDMLYLEDDVRTWADSDAHVSKDSSVIHRDANGGILQAGDTVSIIKDLEVKGAGFTAKRGTAVRNISLTDNPEQIEGRVNGVKIVLLTCFLKKS